MEKRPLKHTWQFNTCIYCGCIREVVKIGSTFRTLYYDNAGRSLNKRPECSGSIKSKAII